MPSRKSDSSSLRRLSSIASLHSLNPFHRRRSNNATDTISSSSNVSLPSSTAANPPEPQKSFSSSQAFTEHENFGAAPPPSSQPQTRTPQRKSSYFCLPDDPIGGMPRSRTFSNLPLPARTKRSGDCLMQSKSHARLPSNRLPTSRLPSPRFSTRRHSVTRLSSVNVNVMHDQLRPNRSDTEPLLQNVVDRNNSVHRSTAFKENISLSPIKQLSSMGSLDEEALFTSSPPCQIEPGIDALPVTPPQMTSSPLVGPNLVETSANVGLSDAWSRRAARRVDFDTKFASSPAYRIQNRPPTPQQPVQRGYSQPLLSSRTKLRSSHGEIKQTRLMSARQAPTPPPPKTPLSSEDLDLVKLRSNISTNPSQVSELSCSRLAEGPTRRSKVDLARTNANAVSPLIVSIERGLKLTAFQILTAEPFGFWTGRFSSLNDRYRNEELLESHTLDTSAPASRDSNAKSETDQMHSTEANVARMRRAIEFLYAQCASEEAKTSFLRWQNQLATALNLPELALSIHGSNCALEMTLRKEGEAAEPSSRKKASFVDRLFAMSRSRKTYGTA